MPENSSQEEFLKDLEPNNDNPFNESTEQEAEPEKEEADGEEARNRRERRLQAKLQAERESSIALAARLEALTEAQKFTRETTPSSYEEKAKRIYGTETPEQAAATELLLASLKEAKEEAKNEALAALRAERQSEQDEVAKEEKTLDSMIEEIEDETGLTLDPQTQKAFFTYLEKLSPKDSQGNILAYADHHAVWEEMQSRKEKAQNTRAKELASRSMTRTGASTETNLQEDVMSRYLRENGLL